jgi:hypothetical protein
VLAVDDARVELAPGALLTGRVEVREAGAARVALHRLPRTAAEPAAAAPTLPDLAGLPESLPPARLERLVVPRVELGAHNAHPKPFRWTAPADTITRKHRHVKRLLGSLHRWGKTTPGDIGQAFRLATLQPRARRA